MDRLDKYARLPELAYGLGLSPMVSRFDSEAGHTKYAPVTQLEESWSYMPFVVGSSPTRSTASHYNSVERVAGFYPASRGFKSY